MLLLARVLLVVLGAFIADTNIAYADIPLAVCLSHESIGVIAFETSSSDGFVHDTRSATHYDALSFVAQSNLKKFGASVFTVRSRLYSSPELAALTAPLDEAVSRNATMLLVISLNSEENRLSSSYLNGDQYPLRTIRLQVSTKVIDTNSRDIISSLEWPSVVYAKTSIDMAVTELLSTDFSAELARAMSDACEGRTPPDVHQVSRRKQTTVARKDVDSPNYQIHSGNNSINIQGQGQTIQIMQQHP